MNLSHFFGKPPLVDTSKQVNSMQGYDDNFGVLAQNWMQICCIPMLQVKL
jgi:hypothetical protein